jgi:GNAT superfamily N-acetyltransferase
LKPHLSEADCVNPGDLQPDTFHLAAIYENGIVGIASFEMESHPDLPAQNPARLRGMATDPNFHRKGIGRNLVNRGIEILRTNNVDLLWFNARINAFPFYQSLGFDFHGEYFDLPKIGPHKVMYKYLK